MRKSIKLKEGVAFLAATCDLPIVSVRITSIEYMKNDDLWKHRRKLQVTFGESIYFSGLSGIDSTNPGKELCERVAVYLMKRAVALMGKLTMY